MSSIFFYSTRKTQKLDRIGALKGTIWDFSTFLSQNINKIEGGPFSEKNPKKIPQCQKTGSVDPLEFFNVHSIAKHQKIERGTFWLKKFEKSPTMPEKTGNPLNPARYCMLRK